MAEAGRLPDMKEKEEKAEPSSDVLGHPPLGSHVCFVHMFCPGKSPETQESERCLLMFFFVSKTSEKRMMFVWWYLATIAG